MSKELVISANRHETKVAILEDDQLVEIYFQRANEYSLAGSIHKGRVTRVLPGMQSAFVDLGLERDTFLYVSDFFDETGEEIDRVAIDERPSRPASDERPSRVERDRDRERAAPPTAPSPAPVTAESKLADEPAPAAAEGSPELQDEAGAEARDRRGRRSRRRRNRGRGFPESKYAGTREATETEPAVQESSEEMMVLPGESLAKYRQPGYVESDEEASGADGEPSEASETAIDAEGTLEFGEEGEEEEAQSELQVKSEPEPSAQFRTGASDNEEEDFPPDVATIANDNPEELPPANAIPDAPIHTTAGPRRQEIGEIESRRVPRGITPTSLDEPASEDTSDNESEIDGSENEADQNGEEPSPESEASPSNDDDEDREIQALILSGDAADIEEVSPSEAREGALTANVREQGSRFLHRGSRRMRRRSRGGDRTSEPSPALPPPPARVEYRAEHHRPALKPEKPAAPSISELLKEGQEILVQIAKEPLGQKGARITSHIALPGRYVVYMPTLDHMGVSRKIASDDERQRLKRILQKYREGVAGGYIIRTAGEDKSEDDIAADMTFLANLWLDIRQKAEKKPAPILLHHDLDIVQRVLRDQVNDTYKTIWVDSEDVYESILRFVQRFQPALVSRVKLYTRPAPIFDAFNVTNELEKALRPKVWLKSGGYIVINQTEALVAIDVNTGKFVGKSNRLEDTIVKTNTEAVKEIVRQLRLRDLGGIIVIDFIDMDERKNRQKVMQALEEAMRADRAPYKILQFNDFGLVAITRKRVKQSLERTLCAPCPYCEGAGYVKSVQTIIGEILQEATKIARAVEGPDVALRVHPDVAKVLKSNQNRFLEEIEEILKRPVLVTSDAGLHHEKFDLA
jgi:ribonuclease G